MFKPSFRAFSQTTGSRVFTHYVWLQKWVSQRVRTICNSLNAQQSFSVSPDMNFSCYYISHPCNRALARPLGSRSVRVKPHNRVYSVSKKRKNPVTGIIGKPMQTNSTVLWLCGKRGSLFTQKDMNIIMNLHGDL